MAGRGIASEVPAKFVMDHLFERGNLGLATAAATSMLITVVGGGRALALLAGAPARPEVGGMTASPALQPNGAPPSRMTPGRIGIYAFLVADGAVLPAAALRHDRDLAEDHGRDPARQHPGVAAGADLRAWIEAWSSACTGLALQRHQRRLLEFGAAS